MSDYNLRKTTDLTNITFEDIINLASTLPHKSEDITFTGFKTPSPAESLQLDKIVSTDIFESGPSSPTNTKPTIITTINATNNQSFHPSCFEDTKS